VLIFLPFAATFGKRKLMAAHRVLFRPVWFAEGVDQYDFFFILMGI
jgi:hypothetical protein